MSQIQTNNPDYHTVSGRLIKFNNGDGNNSTRDISVAIIDDSRTESTESFTIKLSAVNNGGLVPLTQADVAKVNITDDDSMYIIFVFS